MNRRRVNKGYFNHGDILEYNKQTKILSDNPIDFRFANVKKGEFRGNQIISAWLSTGSSKVIKTDSLRLREMKETLRGNKFLNSRRKVDVLITQIDPTLEKGTYDPIFGLPFAGGVDDVRSVGFIPVEPGGIYLFNLVGVEATEEDYTNVGTFGSAGSTTGGDLPIFNDGNVTDKGTFGWLQTTTGGDLPVGGEVFGDLYTCKKTPFHSDVANLDFVSGDTAVWNGSIWVKNPIVASAEDGYLCDTNDFVSAVAGITFQDTDVAVLGDTFVWTKITPTSVINVLEFDVDDQTNAVTVQIAYNEKYTLKDDTTQVKIWANDLLVDTSNNIIETYRISEYEQQYNSKSEVVDFTIAEDEDQLVGAIRKRKNRDILVINLS